MFIEHLQPPLSIPFLMPLIISNAYEFERLKLAKVVKPTYRLHIGDTAKC